MDSNDLDWKLPTPAQLLFIGPSQCGKSTKLLDLVKEDVFDRPLNQIIYCAPTARQGDYVNSLLEASKGKQLLVVQKLPSVDVVRNTFPQGPVLLILDDLLCFPDLNGLSELSSMHAHHQDISCVYCVQNPYQKTKKVDLTTLSRNCTGRFVFYQTNDWRLYHTLNNTLFPDRKQFLTRCLLAAKEEGQNYVFINTASFASLPRRYMCYTGLFSKERGPFFFDLLETV